MTQEYSATYEITMSNTSFYDYAFASSIFTPSVETTNNTDLEVVFTLEGIEFGEIIPSGETRTFTAIFNMYAFA